MTEQSNPTTILKRMYAAEAEYLSAGGPGKADFELIAEHFSPDVVLHQAEALPYGGIWRGHADLERFFIAMSRTWAVFEFVEQEFVASDEATGTAVVLTQVRARSRATGRELEFPILQTVTVQGGQIIEVRPFYWDTAAIAAACTPAQTVDPPQS
ncbi:nuclear transport factor 2 family protein [Saccharopolyspora sp. WRP15-2]|uniref:Nuclear transport factor 2 family protein n=1 Tax=Saccharopolyspora oryzae TaxID=2997343 RepID=A0ABT4V963_9PSEU|nr:nuclear transport factor 2 family protein [Saccharopolyspora oryzae]MDA3630473.1 nuclear transport factor 2 family protein [Saccharopolyspora oryzae]